MRIGVVGGFIRACCWSEELGILFPENPESNGGYDYVDGHPRSIWLAPHKRLESGMTETYCHLV